MAEQPRRAAVLGKPIAHSLSPLLHRSAYAALGLNWRYDAIECDEAALPAVLAERHAWAGFSCTMPLKRAVLGVADEVAPVAAAVGAGNTLLPRSGGGWIADNTDVTGIVRTIRDGGVAPESVTILGAGGTAQAVVAALAESGVARCTVLLRDTSRAGPVRAVGDRLGVAVQVGALDVQARALEADLVVSTLPTGAADAVTGRAWHAQQVVFDVVYHLWPTALARAAELGGARVLNGAVLLLHQAAVQVELMTGRPAPLDAMRAALRAGGPVAGR